MATFALGQNCRIIYSPCWLSDTTSARVLENCSSSQVDFACNQIRLNPGSTKEQERPHPADVRVHARVPA
jgi:hypothetical protein